MTVGSHNGARRAAVEKAKRLDLARVSMEELSDDECLIIYIDVEGRLTRSATDPGEIHRTNLRRLMAVGSHDSVRRAALAKAKRLDAARASLNKLTDDECQVIYIEIEGRLIRSMEAGPRSLIAEARLEPIDVLSLPFKEAKCQVIEAFERDYLSRLMQRSKNSVSEAARLAHVDRTNFHKLLRRSGLRPLGTKAREETAVAKHTTRILKILDENRRGLRAYEIAEKITQTVPNAFSILKSLERQGRVKRHGKRYDTLWALPGVEPVHRVETIHAAVVEVLSTAKEPMDSRALRHEIGNVLFRSINKRPTDASLQSGISRLVSHGVIVAHGANEHGSMYVLARKGATSTVN